MYCGRCPAQYCIGRSVGRGVNLTVVALVNGFLMPDVFPVERLLGILHLHCSQQPLKGAHIIGPFRNILD